MQGVYQLFMGGTAFNAYALKKCDEQRKYLTQNQVNCVKPQGQKFMFKNFNKKVKFRTIFIYLNR